MSTNHFMVQVTTNDPAPIITYSNRPGRDVTIQNVGDSPAFLGGRGVHFMNYGYRLDPGTAISFELDWRDELYAFASPEGNTTLAVISISLERQG